MSVDDKSELNSEQIAQEFNRRKWKGAEWESRPSWYGRMILAVWEDGSNKELDIQDARALLAGWQAMEELAEVKIGLAQVSKLCDAEIELRQRVDWELDQARAQLAALTAERDGFKLSLAGILAERREAIKILGSHVPAGNIHARNANGEIVLAAAVDALTAEVERIREPADGVEAMARRIVTQLQLAFPDVPVYVTAAEQAAVIAAELRKGIAPAVGTWQPIETAPKDGTRILVAINGVSRAVVSYWDGNAWATVDGHSWEGRRVTHWMPLPAPPIADEGSES